MTTTARGPVLIDGASAGWRILACTGLLLAGFLIIVGPREPFASSIAPIQLAAADSDGAGSSVGMSVHHDGSGANEGVGQLFGMESEPVMEGALLDKWGRVQEAIGKALEAIAQCQAGKSCPASVQRLLDLSLEGAGRNGRARVGLINRAVDLAVRPVSDETQWGVQDHWSDPLETLHSSSGDCEDYAIVKYAALLAAGLSKDAVKLVVLKNRLPDEDHAVVAVWIDQQWLILDNRTLTLVRDIDVRRAIPEFVLDDQGVRRFVRRSRVNKATS
jgi:predicted transglutaminase-like cysteine proteinase